MFAVRGNTYPVKDALKALGCRWDFDNKVWMAPEDKRDEVTALVPTPRFSVDDGVSKTVTQLAVPVIPETGIAWSPEQQAVFEWFKNGVGNLVVRARAGTGKTTTIKHAFYYSNAERKLYVVFNKKNQKEARAKITDPSVEVRTLHSLGLYFIKQVWTKAEPDDSVEFDRLQAVYRDLPDEVTGAVLKLVGFCKNTTINPTLSEVVDVADRYGCEAPSYEDDENGGYTVTRLAELALKVLEASTVKDSQNRISFDDMVWLPVRMNWVRRWFDLVVVDECQDMNLPQLIMASTCVKTGGRVVVVGDDAQAIYGFRGAASDGIDMMKIKLSATELGLKVTRRCPKVVVQMAQQYVPDFLAAPEAPEGVIEQVSEAALVSTVQPGDAILSRINAPLMSLCLALLRNKVPARIEGRDIGKALKAIAEKLNGKSVPHFIEKVAKWEAKQISRALKSTKYAEEKCAAVRDQAQLMIAVAEGAVSIHEIMNRLDTLFQDSDKDSGANCVVLSSVHKAKGLEWDRVYLLENTFNRCKQGQRPEQGRGERNIRYVAITRSKRYLGLAGGAVAAPSQAQNN